MPEYSFEPTKRFSSRAKVYAQYRPGYPEEIVSFIQSQWNLHPESFIADIGAGTGIFSEMLLKKGYNVICIEPNKAMLLEAEDFLRKYPNAAFTNGSGESTGLCNESVDLVVIAQAFHWMDAETTGIEANRILKPAGKKLLIWNIQRKDTPFMLAYTTLKDKYSIKHAVPKRIDLEKIAKFFESGSVETKSLLNEQTLNFEGLQGQLLSSSYLPLEGDENYEIMLQELRSLYEEHQVDNSVTMRFDTELYFGA